MFSIILPNYNHARFLNKRIESILNQTFTDFEIIILDDCSSDNSREIIANYQDKRIKYKIFNEENSGSPFLQWKKGLELAKYDYVWIAESDDWADENFLSEAYQILEKNQNISLYYTNSQLVAEDETYFDNSIKKYTQELDLFLWNTNHLMNGRKYVEDYLIHKNFILNASSVILKKTNAIKNIDEIINYKTSGDWLFWAKILQNGEVYFNEKKLNYFRHSTQSTRNYNTLEKKQLRIIEKAKVQEKILNIFNFSQENKTKTKKELIKEWAKHHSLRELFTTNYLNLKKISFFKDIGLFQFLSISILYKLQNQWLKRLK